MKDILEKRKRPRKHTYAHSERSDFFRIRIVAGGSSNCILHQPQVEQSVNALTGIE